MSTDTTTAATAVTGINLDLTFGCLYVGTTLAMGLWGAGTIQVYYYFDKYKDSMFLRAHVFAVWVLDTLHQAFLLQSTYMYLVTNYGSLENLGSLNRPIRDSIILTALICALVQSMFVVRIYRLSKRNYFVTGFIILLVAAQFISTLIYYIKCFHFKTFAELQTIFTITRVINSVTAVTDASIALVLVYLLQSSRSGFKKSDSIINRLIAFAINTGLITGICAVISLITGLTLPNTLVYIMFYVTLSRLYMNSMLASLNSRKNLRGNVVDSSSQGPVSISMNDMRTGAQSQGKTAPRIVNIKVDTETILDNNGQDHLGRTPSESDIEAYPTKGSAY